MQGHKEGSNASGVTPVLLTGPRVTRDAEDEPEVAFGVFRVAHATFCQDRSGNGKRPGAFARFPWGRPLGRKGRRRRQTVRNESTPGRKLYIKMGRGGKEGVRQWKAHIGGRSVDGSIAEVVCRLV